MKKTFFAILAGASIMLGACSPSYDKDKDHMVNLETLTKEMTEEEQNEFYDALGRLKDHVYDTGGTVDTFLNILDGKTADDIIEYANEVAPPKKSAKDGDDEPISDIVVTARGSSYTPSGSSRSSRSSGPRYDANNPVESKAAMEKGLSYAKMQQLTRAMTKLYQRHGMSVRYVIHGLTVDEIIELAN